MGAGSDTSGVREEAVRDYAMLDSLGAGDGGSHAVEHLGAGSWCWGDREGRLRKSQNEATAPSPAVHP